MTAVTFLISGAGEGNRTLATSLEGWGSTIELHPQNKKWSEQQDSNLRPPGPKPGALPNCAMPRYIKNTILFAVVYYFVLNNKAIVSYHANVCKYFFIIFYNFCKKLYTIKNHHKIRYSSYKTAIIQALYCLLNRRFHPIVLYFTFNPSLCEHPHPHGQRYRKE